MEVLIEPAAANGLTVRPPSAWNGCGCRASRSRREFSRKWWWFNRRKKIEKNPAKPKYLLTEPWVGYRFEIPTEERSQKSEAR
jgi:hypothetical protein